MQQQQPQQQYGAPPPPDMAPFASSSGAVPTPHMHHPPPPPEAASPINSRPPPPSRFDELVPPDSGGACFPDDHAVGDEAERGGVPGNRWPRQETLALLKIRSDMDAAFRDATLKGPLWEDVSRKLAELGYRRSAKKCKEKFENVHKYYKRTKEGRAGRQDGKSYRFFTQLEALHTAGAGVGVAGAAGVPAPTSAATGTPLPISMAAPSPSRIPISPAPAFTPARPTAAAPAPSDMTTAAPTLTPTPISLSAAGISFSSDTFSTSSYDSDDEETEEGGGAGTEGRKRKREGGQGGSRKMMAFFEGLMKQVMERQETMQQRFLETIEKREQDRMIREEAWKRQEIARLNREHELLAQERAMAASRDAAVMSFLQKISGGQAMSPAVLVPMAPPPQPMPAPTPQVQTQHPPPPPPAAQKQPKSPAVSIPTPPPPQRQPDPPIHHQHPPLLQLPAPAPPPSTSTDLVLVPESHDIVASGSTMEGASVSSSRWPKSEVHALIKLRSGLESKYQEAGPKGPLWEEISAGMQQLGYSRSSKRCKEKWENINKYFKKVKESNKKRPEDAKTCPYFHQLDALYRKKAATSGGGGGLFSIQRPLEIEPSPNPIPQQQRSADTPISSSAPPPALVSAPVPVPAPQPSPQPHPQGADSKNNSNNNGSGSIQVPTSNGGLPPSFFEQGTSGGAAMKKPEDIMNELMDHQKQAGIDDYDKMEEHDSDNLDDEDDDDDDEEDRKMQYKIQFQPQNVNVGGGGNGSSGGSSSTAAKATGSFLAMVQ